MHEALQEAVGPENVAAIVAGQRTIVASCGSGMTAGVLWLGLQTLGAEWVSLYDEVCKPMSHCKIDVLKELFEVVDGVCHARRKQNHQKRMSQARRWPGNLHGLCREGMSLIN